MCLPARITRFKHVRFSYIMHDLPIHNRTLHLTQGEGRAVKPCPPRLHPLIPSGPRWACQVESNCAVGWAGSDSGNEHCNCTTCIYVDTTSPCHGSAHILSQDTVPSPLGKGCHPERSALLPHASACELESATAMHKSQFKKGCNTRSG